MQYFRQFFPCWVIFCYVQTFLYLIFSKKSKRNTISVTNSLNPDQARHFHGPDLGPNCLQGLLAGDKVATSGGKVQMYLKYCEYYTHTCLINNTLCPCAISNKISIPCIIGLLFLWLWCLKLNPTKVICKWLNDIWSKTILSNDHYVSKQFC